MITWQNSIQFFQNILLHVLWVSTSWHDPKYGLSLIKVITFFSFSFLFFFFSFFFFGEERGSLLITPITISEFFNEGDETWLRQSNGTCPDRSKFSLGYLYKWGDCFYKGGHQCGACHNASDAKVRMRNCIVKWNKIAKMAISILLVYL